MKTIRKDNLTYNSNTFRVFEDDDKQIRLEFGTKNIEKDVVKINASIQITPKMIMPLVERLLLIAILYQEKYDVDLGLEGKIKIKSKDGE